MIIADKILHLRKKSGYSQEELAEQLKVSRQSVSKWESAQSIPDIKKIMAMAQLFSVSTDYLLRDDIDNLDENEKLETPNEHLINIEEANRFISIYKIYAKKVALGVFLCILSPTLLIMLDTIANESQKKFLISENTANIVGTTWILYR